jgi:serine/threonine protein kinase
VFPSEGEDLLVASGVIVGDLEYLSPEQVNPERLGMPDTVTDVYGLGGILFEILYDEPPNGTPIPGIPYALVNRKGPPTPRRLSSRAARNRALAQRLEPIWLRALEVDRSARQPSVSAFIDDVDTAVAS